LQKKPAAVPGTCSHNLPCQNTIGIALLRPV